MTTGKAPQLGGERAAKTTGREPSLPGAWFWSFIRDRDGRIRTRFTNRAWYRGPGLKMYPHKLHHRATYDHYGRASWHTHCKVCDLVWEGKTKPTTKCYGARTWRGWGSLPKDVKSLTAWKREGYKWDQIMPCGFVRSLDNTYVYVVFRVKP